MENKINGCINILSSRHKCLPTCLKTMHEFWNKRYDYPVYVHYFDDIYDNEDYRSWLRSNVSENIHFISVPYATPSFLDEKELFYNRTNIPYVRGGFTVKRKGYLHMSNFYNNLYKYPETKLHNHDYMLSVDDESIFLKEVPYDFFEVLSGMEDEMAGAIKVTYPHIKKPHEGNFQTRIGMMDHVADYVEKFNLEHKCEFIKNIVKKRDEKYFHENFIFSDSYVFKMKLFETEEWKQWNKFLNESGGVYKFRWGDHELNSLFYHVHYGRHVHDFKTVDEGYHNQSALRGIQEIAPGVKDNKA